MAALQDESFVMADVAKTESRPPFEESCQLISDPGIESWTKGALRDEQTRLLKSLYPNDLERIHKQLWYAGTRGNISALHRQTVLRREIILTEEAGLHLVWSGRIIYVKRLEDQLLSWDYYSNVICADSIIHKAASGFLLTYMKLIQYPSDLKIAKDTGLLHEDISWRSWQGFRSSVLLHLEDRGIHDRFEYGELRLGRLDSIYRLKGLGLNYFTVHRDYWSYFGQSYLTLIALFGLASVALSAMQVMVGFEDLPAVAAVTLYRFAVATLVALGASCAFLLAVYFTLYIWNWSLIFVRRGPAHTASRGGCTDCMKSSTV